jgi:DNA-binding transcriptional ArsR family regulator
MNVGRDIARVAALVADDSRARMLGALMEGRSVTATELALHAGVSAQTARGHLAKLTEASLVVREVGGRCRYFRLAGAAVAEALAALALVAPARAPHATERDGDIEPIRIARTCYDHLAGRLGVAVTEVLVKRGYLKAAAPDFRLTASGASFLEELGVDVERARGQRRAFARRCLDWTERQPHLAGALGAALATCWLRQEWVRRVPEQRHLVLTPRGRSALFRLFAVKSASLSAPAVTVSKAPSSKAGGGGGRRLSALRTSDRRKRSPGGEP